MKWPAAPRARVVVMAVAALSALPGCGISRVDAPISLRADRRLHMEEPKPEAEVDLPLEVRWRVEGFPITDGNHFGVFVDRPPIGPKKTVRLQVCTEHEKLPPQLGEFRKLCVDDRKTVFFTADTHFRFDCFEPRFTAPARLRNSHTVTVVLLDREDRRVGQAATTVTFEVDKTDAKTCRGLTGGSS